MQKQKTVRINRRRWLRGTGSLTSCLWDPTRQQGCCLGHAAKQLNSYTWDDLAYVSSPKESDIPGCRGDTDMRLVIKVNDSRDMTEKSRERQLRRLFKNLFGIRLLFFN